jgi:serine/threonine protein kinase/formylglycine-generating enzyme required for sulfatase activity
MATMTVSDFLDALHTLPLIDSSHRAELDALAPRFGNVGALAQQLIERGWLTPYQAKLMMSGRASDLVLDQYVLLDLLGEGGMGAVFAARQTRMKRRVAIKVLKPEAVTSPVAVERFQREAEACARLSHPNIVVVHDINRVENVHFLVMEHIDGTDLAQLVQQQGRLPVPQACNYVRQAAIGLQHAHEQGLVHRDVKPQNLMLTKTGIVKVMDLGLARLSQSSGEQWAGLTGTGAIMGTPYYMAPEQVTNAKAVDIRADIYSLGATLYHLLAGKPPFAGMDLVAMVAARVQGTPPEPLENLRSDLPPDLLAILWRMMAHDPADRYRTPADVADALAPFVQASADAAVAQSEIATLMPSDPKFDTHAVSIPTSPSSAKRPIPTKKVATAHTKARPTVPPDATKERRPRRRFGKSLLAFAFIGAMGFAGWHYQEPLTNWMEGFADSLRSHTTKPDSPEVVLLKTDSSKLDATTFESTKPGATKADTTKPDTTKPDPKPPGTQNAKAPPSTQWSGPPDLTLLKPMLVISAIKPVKIEAGENHSLEVKVTRQYCKGPIEVRLEDLPKGVTARPALVPLSTTVCQVELAVQPSAVGTHQIKVIAIAAAARGESTFSLTLTPYFPRQIELNLGGGVKLEVVRIKPGAFRMGSFESETDAPAVEKPQHDVVISKNFYMGKYAVTTQQFSRFVNAAKYQSEPERDGKGGYGFNAEKNQSGGQKPIYTWRNPGWPQTDHHPVVNVTWNDAQAFCSWASTTTGRRVELPYEAEWEYACRAGTKTRYFTGDEPGSLDGYANLPDQTLKDKKFREHENWKFFDIRDGHVFTAPVGSFKPNPWGLYDMTGNVFQWCRDGRRQYTEARVVDPVGPDNHSPAVRGGSWLYGIKEARCASRWRFEDTHRNSNMGFRVVVHPD